MTTFLMNLLLLSSPLFSIPHANAYRTHQPDTRRGVKWLQPETSVLVRLETPSLPLWNPDEKIGEKIPSAFIFNITLQDKQILLFNDVQIMPLANAIVPPRIHAPQTNISLTKFDHGVLPDFQVSSSFELDYWRSVHPGEHPDARYNIYNPVLQIDILGAGIEGYNTLLSEDTQRLIQITLEELEPYQKYPYDKPVTQRLYKISDVLLGDRWPYNQFSPPEALKECTIWSWRCSDFDAYPWYHYVYREAFDEFGKIGSLRHSLVQRYNVLCHKLGVLQATLLVVIVILAFLSVPVYGVILGFRRMKASFEGYEGENLGQFEALLQVEEIGEDEKDEAENRKAGESSGSTWNRNRELSKPLPPLPDE
jgi:hypothetical protein